MSKRFGRNKRRKMQEQHNRDLLDLTAIYARDAARQSSENWELRRRLDRSITFDVTAIENWSERSLDIRTKMMSFGREDYNIVQRLDQRRMELESDRDGFLKLACGAIAEGLFEAINKCGWPRA